MSDTGSSSSRSSKGSRSSSFQSRAGTPSRRRVETSYDDHFGGLSTARQHRRNAWPSANSPKTPLRAPRFTEDAFTLARKGASPAAKKTAGSDIQSSNSATDSTADSTTDDGADNPSPARKKAKANNTIVFQPPSQRITQFINGWAMLAHQALLSREKGPGAMRCSAVRCPRTEVEQTVLYRCEECFFPQAMCADCIKEHHSKLPFHLIVKWRVADGFWDTAALEDVGVEVCLGHGGAVCRASIRDPRHMTLGLESGFQCVWIRFCDCLPPGADKRTPDAIQLIEFGLFPASWEVPTSAFSVQLHKAFHLLSLQSQTNGKDFITYLKRRTNNVLPDEVPDRYREFMMNSREFTYLCAVHRAGLLPGRAMEAGSLAVLCAACPQPGINMDKDWRSRPPGERFLDALFHTVDGNFHQNQKIKPLDPNDFALTEGAAYFANTNEFAKYQATLGPAEPEPSTCHKFGAMGYGGYWGNVSGTVGFSCARHMVVLPGGGVDLQKGERFANVDFTMISGLQRWMSLDLHVSGYNINCQYRINLGKRLADFKEKTVGFKSVPEQSIPKTIACVGKFHLPAHIPACRYKFSYNYMPGVGRTDGEAPERIWATLNALGASTREMTSGHRHDRINDHHSDMNIRRMQGIVKLVVKRYSEAEDYFQAVAESIACTELSIPPAVLKQWMEDERTFLKAVVDIKNHKDLVNPYEPDAAKGLTQKEMMATLKVDGTIVGVETIEDGLMGTIAEGIELQYAKSRLLVMLADGVDVTSAATAEARRAFLERVEVWRPMYARYLAPIMSDAMRHGGDEDRPRNVVSTTDNDEADDEADNRADNDATPVKAGLKRKAKDTGSRPRPKTTRRGEGPVWDEIDSITLDLPSQLGRKALQHAGVKVAAAIEYLLQQGEAKETLDGLRSLLITAYALQRHRQHEKGYIHNMRGKVIQARKSRDVDGAATRYRHARLCLIALGMAADDTTFRALTSKDMVAFKVSTEDDQLGDGKVRPSWVWEDFSFVEQHDDEGVKAYCGETLKVFWFRRSALKNRWNEELLLLREEMKRIEAFFGHYVEKWGRIATEQACVGDEASAAYAKRQQRRHWRLQKNAEVAFNKATAKRELRVTGVQARGA